METNTLVYDVPDWEERGKVGENMDVLRSPNLLDSIHFPLCF
jgi:hypothetical protein